MRSEIALAAVLALAPSAAAAGSVLTGIDVLEETGFRELRGKRIGLCTNQTGKDRHGRSTVHVLANAEGVQLKAIFAPEHGFDEMTESFVISSSTLLLPDGRAIPIYPSFGAKVAPTDVMLAGLDALVFDIQDVGARFYTYAATMAMGMKMAASHRLPFYVLDRPNPINGEIVEVPIRDPD